MDHAKVIVKQSGEKLDKKKSNQFNYESVIEITLPSAPTHPQPVLELPREKPVEEKLEEPITPVICTPMKPKIPSHNNNNHVVNMSPTSLHESLVSNKQNPMEWDSFIPVSFECFPSGCYQQLKCILIVFSALGLRIDLNTAKLPDMQSDGAGR